MHCHKWAASSHMMVRAHMKISASGIGDQGRPPWHAFAYHRIPLYSAIHAEKEKGSFKGLQQSKRVCLAPPEKQDLESAPAYLSRFSWSNFQICISNVLLGHNNILICLPLLIGFCPPYPMIVPSLQYYCAAS